MKLSDLLNTEIESAKMELGPDGNMRVIFAPEELATINAWLKGQLDSTYQDWVPLWNESVENKETYRTVRIPIPDGGQSVYPAPIARIPADQVIASIYNAILRPRPVFSIDAYLNADYQVPQQSAGPTMAVAAPATAEECAHRLEQGYEFIVRERIQLPQKLLRGVRHAVQGAPDWWKVVVDPEERTTFSARKVDGAIIDLGDKYEETRTRGDIVKWYLVPYTNAMHPLDAESIDQAEWFAERTPMRPDEIAKRYAVGELFCVPDDATASQMTNTTVDARNEFRARAEASTEKKVVSTPLQEADVWLVWFYRNVKYIDPQDPVTPDGKKNWKIKRLNLVSKYHRTVGKAMDCHLNGYEHQCRPYELVDQMDEGDCTVGRLKYHQTMFTYGAQSEIKNAFLANNLVFWYDKNNPDVADHFSRMKVINVGDHIPGVDGKDWGVVRIGAEHYSMLELLKFFLSMSQLDSRENEFTMGGRPPGRTPATTVEKVYQHAEEVKTMFLARLSIKLSRLLRLDAETRRQYQPLGEVLPVWNPQAKETVQIPFTFPVGDVLDNFRIALTAADEQLSQEHDPQQVMLRKQALMADGEYVAKVVAAIINVQQPLPQTAVALFAKIISRVQSMTRSLMGQIVTDEENYDLTPELEALIQERNETLIATRMQQFETQQTGGMNGAQGAGAGAGANQPAAAGTGTGGSVAAGPQGQPPVSAPASAPPAPVPGAAAPPVQ